MTTPSPFLAWHAEAMRLADRMCAHAIGSALFTPDRRRAESEALAAARAALSAHLLAVPIGEPVAWRDPSNVDAKQSITFGRATAEKWPHIYTVPLFTKPEGMA
jgi:hypothetical protein